MTQSTADRPQRPPSEEEGSSPGRPSTTVRTLGPGSMAGYLCADPAMTFVGNGKALVKLRIAVNKRVLDEASGQWADGETEYTDVTVWGRQGENVMESLRTGDRVVVNGIWQESRWFGRDDQWHSRKSLTARDIGPSLMFKQVNVVGRKEDKK